MKKPRIFVDTPLHSGALIALPERSSNHVGRVLRMRPKEPLILFNGRGKAWQGKIDSINKKMVTVYLDSFIEDDTQSPLILELGQTISRGERIDYAIQKATETGVTTITPLFTDRCEVKLTGERSNKRVEHWRQVAISACEQCGRNIPPTIHAPMKIDQWLSSRNTELNIVLHHRTQQKLSGFAQPKSVSILVGPEGGLTPQEIELAEKNSFHPIAFGPRVLRTETAPVVAISIMQHLWGDY